MKIQYPMLFIESDIALFLLMKCFVVQRRMLISRLLSGSCNSLHYKTLRHTLAVAALMPLSLCR